MSVTQTNNVQVGLVYEDGKKRTYTFNGVSATNLTGVESAIVSINANPSLNFYKTFVSAGGASATGIYKGTIYSIEEEQIYP